MKLPEKLKILLKNEIDPAFAKRAEYIFNKISDKKPKKILDVGCGRGFYVFGCSLFNFIKEIHGLDNNDEYLKIAKRNCVDKRIKLRKGNAYSLPYPDKYFDFIICSEVLEHLKNDNKGLQELHRVLKPKGTLIITVPNKNFPFLWDPLNWLLMKVFKTHINKDIWWLAGIWADHERLYDEKDIINKVNENGFKILDSQRIINFCWPFSHFLLYGIGKNLVERLKFNSFNRFNFNGKKTISYYLGCLISLPSSLIKNYNKDPSVNISLLIQK